MVSPCSSSSKQMAHSPESLDRMSSEKDNTVRDKLRKELPRTPNCASDVQLTHWILHNHLFNHRYQNTCRHHLCLRTGIPLVFERNTQSPVGIGCFFVECSFLLSFSLYNSLMMYFNNPRSGIDELFYCVTCLPAYLAATATSVNTRGERLTGTVCGFSRNTLQNKSCRRGKIHSFKCSLKIFAQVRWRIKWWFCRFYTSVPLW